jgi:S1-C subfamily serine protease
MNWNWKKQLAGVLLVSALFFVILPTPETPKAKFERAQNQTVLLTEKGGQASGFVVERTGPQGRRVFIWTAAHVVDKAPVQEVVKLYHFQGHKAGKTVFKARVVAYSVKHDLALLLADVPPGFFQTATFADENVCLGDPVFVVGNALGAAFDGSVTQGYVSQCSIFVEDWPWGIALDQTTAIIVPGNSGGPVFNAKGQIVGVAVGWARMPGIGFYVPLNRIEEWAKDAGVYWAMYGNYCPSDSLLEANIAVAAARLLPPPPAPDPDPVGPGIPQPGDPPVNSFPIAP